MMTVRQIERCWVAKAYGRLFRELIAARPEAAFEYEGETPRAPLAAAMAVVRLEELSQSHVPLYAKLLRAILTAQEGDGGWGEPLTTALCLRALLCGQGNGLAIQRGLSYLAALQKEEGIWPSQPLRRMPADPQGSAFILYQLGGDPGFRKAVRVSDAARWFEAHGDELDEPTRQLWQRASLRCRPRVRTEPVLPDMPLWFKVA